MFSHRQKREIADAVQKVLRDTNHPELPAGEIQFSLHVDGAEDWSWADIKNNGSGPSLTSIRTMKRKTDNRKSTTEL